ncbi:uncharacterized protein HMPREF1541_01060 [Cyphellophora europaea CBS 101466]|uniref:Arrestin-like N-terminal domain-containing protein n=1 Tax=Cyphellophora europaea (strain CBS 101466) TaxID=1220924 RepID=W2SDT7_CYPE1|nr:uncharacterized protein HMPREF1541_01060 [Cyphellophora europaea CBS 101466]ETN46871.1 hypothetical protein HMPREF1541_01060 [Cyphellophora europaea CBS 101466]
MSMDGSVTTTPGDMPSLLSTTVPQFAGRARSLPTNALQDGRRRSTIAGIVLRKKSEIEIVLEGQEVEFVNVYSTHDSIQGHVELRFEKDTPLEELIITFEGHSATYVEKLASTAPTTGRTTGKHAFLKLLQPVDGDELPLDNILRADTTYSVPFLFRVPPTLLPYVCSHKVDHEGVRKPHLELPPSMGDPTIAGDGHALMDDIAPAMSRVSYAVRVRATSRLANGKPFDLAEQTKKVLIVPAKDEAPPVHIDDDGLYALRRERSVKKGLFKIGKVGRITAETTQPRSFRLPHPSKRITEPVSTNTTVCLRFDPVAEGDHPPSMGCITSRLRAYTFFGAAPYRVLPEIHRYDNWSTLHGVYSESIELSQRNLSTVTWTRHAPGTSPISRTSSAVSACTDARRPSTWSASSSTASNVPEPSAAYNPDLPFYTAQVLVPLALPTPQGNSKTKVFLPTFHSCIISRTYTLDLMLSYNTPGTSVSTPHITLKCPVQVSAEGGTPPPTAAPYHGMAATEEEEAALLAEIERQFGLNLGLGLESPDYDEVAPLLHAQRHASIATSAPVSGGAPPDYTANNTAFARSTRVGGARTTSVSAFGFT